MIEGVILDLYGTLIRPGLDSKPYVPFARAARPDDPASVLRASVVTDAPTLGALAERMGILPPRDLDGLEAELRREVDAVELFDGVIETLAGLRDGGFRLGLISNLASPYKAPYFRHGLDRSFNVALFSCDVGLRKPDPALYRRMAADLGVPPDRLVMVGDKRRNDYDAPKAVGMGAILLARHGETAGFPAIASLRELPGLLRNGRD